MSRLYELLRTFSPQLTSEIPKRVGVRVLSRETPKVLGALRKDHAAALITYQNVPHFLLIPIEPDRYPALVMALAPEAFADDLRAANESFKDDLPTGSLAT